MRYGIERWEKNGKLCSCIYKSEENGSQFELIAKPSVSRIEWTGNKFVMRELRLSDGVEKNRSHWANERIRAKLQELGCPWKRIQLKVEWAEDH